MSPAPASAAAIARAVRGGELSAAAVLESALARLDETEPRISAFLHVGREAARERARAIDEAAARGDRTLGLLAGVPVALKDNLCTRGVPTTAGSRILAGYRPPYDATVVERLEAEGAVVIGKANLDEFAMGSSTERSAFRPTRNPWALDRVPGGSSGGSAAAVAAGSACVALGSDTGGSIRQPAAFCGVVGMKPTYGLVSRYGLIAFASSLDQIGPFGRTVEDVALTLSAISGHDPRDSTSIPEAPKRYHRELDRWPSGLRVGVPREHLAAEREEGVREVIEGALDRLRAMGAEVVDVELPRTDYGIATYYIVATAEASSNLARYDGVHYGHRTDAHEGDLVRLYARSRAEGFGDEVKRRIFLGTYVLSAGFYDAYYLKALKARTLIRKDFQEAFARCDVIAGPTTPTVAFPFGSRTEDPLLMYAADVFTVAANLAGIPGISVPAGLSGGLPVGLQLLAPAGRDELLLRAAHGFEGARGPIGEPTFAEAAP